MKSGQCRSVLFRVRHRRLCRRARVLCMLPPLGARLTAPLFVPLALLTEGVSMISWTEVRSVQELSKARQKLHRSRRIHCYPAMGEPARDSHAEPRSHRDVLAPAGENDNDCLLTERSQGRSTRLHPTGRKETIRWESLM